MKKLDRISQLNNESNENPIDLLYKSVIGHINKSNLSEKSRGELNEKVEKTKLDFNFNKVNIVVFGDFNSGKTTFINTLIFTLLKPENNKCTIKEFDKFLPHAITENTYYITIIENSDDDNYSLEHIENGDELKKIISKDKSKISEYLLKLDGNATKIITEIKNNQVNEEEGVKVPITTVKIKIPNLNKNFRIIDTAGLINERFRNESIKFLKEKCLANIFLTVRSFTQENVYNKEYLKATKEIKENFPDSIYLLILTKVDALLEIKKEKDIKDLRKNMNGFLYEQERKNESNQYKINTLNYFKAFILSCKKVFESSELIVSNEHYLDGLNRLKSTLLKIEEDSHNQKLLELKNKLKMILEEFNAKKPLIKKYSEDEVNLIFTDFCKTINEFVRRSNEYFQSIKDGKNKEFRDIIYKEFIINDKTKIDICNFRNNYISDQMRLLSTVFKASLISDLTKIMLKTLEQYFNSPLLELTENKLKSKVIDNLNLLIIIAMNKLFGISVHERALKITEELWFWKRLNTFDDVIKCFLFEIDIEFNNQCSKYYNDNIIYNFEKSIFNAKKEIKEKIDFSSCLSIGITSSCNFKPLENKVLIESELNELKLKSEYIKNLKKFLIDI